MRRGCKRGMFFGRRLAAEGQDDNRDLSTGPRTD